MKIMASGPFTSWQIDGETMETVTAYFWGAPKSLQMVTAAIKLKDACSLEEKLWPKKHMTICFLSILKSRDITLLTKVHLVEAIVVTCGCENWTIKKAEH